MAYGCGDGVAFGRARPRAGFVVLGLTALLALAAAPVAGADVPTIQVRPTVETAPVPNVGDAADDPAIWIHPTDPSLSTIIGTDKTLDGGLGVYDLSGQQLSFFADGRLNNVDVRYNFPLGGARVSLVGATNRSPGQLARMDFFSVDPATRLLTKVGSVQTSPAIKTARGFSFYVSPVSGKYYAFVSDIGNTDQYELSGTSGSVRGTLVRQFTLPNPTEGLVADDELGRIYVAEENIGGIWRYGAEPGDGSTGVKIDGTTETGGTIAQDVKGLALYSGANRSGYLIATSQGGNSFHLYNRGDNAKVGVFKIVDGGVDGVTGTDGIDVTNFGLGSAFPAGLFVAQDTANGGGGNQNFKIVPWQSIANGFMAPLLIDSTWDPRLIGAPGGGALTPPSSGTSGSGLAAPAVTSSATGIVAPVATPPPPPPLPPASDVTAPVAVLSGSRLQRLAPTISARVVCPDEPCRASATGSVRVPRVGAVRARTYTLEVVTRSIAQGTTQRFRPRVSAAARRAIRRALRAGRQVIVRFTVTVADTTGNKQTLTRLINVRR